MTDMFNGATAMNERTTALPITPTVDDWYSYWT